MARRSSSGVRDVRVNALDKAAESNKMSKVYSTVKINQILDDIKRGKKPDLDPFFHGKKDYRDCGITFERTEEEEDEYRKCALDALYFIEKYVKFKNDKGFTLVTLRDYQKEVLHLMSDERWDDELQDITFCNRRICLLQSRQTSKTTSTVAYLIWFMLFHADRNLLITANKEKTTKEILQKLKEALKGLPFFLKPGIEEVSKIALRLENGSNIRAVATTGDSATGDSINILIIDEAALIPQNVLTEFWASVFPTMSSFKQSQIIVMSTPRGRSGLYYDIYSGAVAGTNGFVHKRVDWWQVPGHDEKWKQDQIAVFGQALWDREFALSFDTNESRLIPPEDFQFIERIKKNYIPCNIYGVPKRVSEKILWDPSFHPDQLTEYDLMKRRFVCICDLAEGKEKGEYGKEDADYNVINIFEIQLMSPSRIMKNRLGYKAVKQKNVIRLVQRGVYIDNNKDEEECAQALQHIAFDIFKNGQGEIDNMKILYEKNFNGKNFIKVFSKHDMYYESIIKGFTTTGGEHGKKYFCELTQKMIALRQIIINQDNPVPVMSTIEQLKTFGKVKNSYAGLSAHDDLAITVMWCSRFFEDEEYFEWLDDWMSILPTFDYHENPTELIMIQKVLEMLQIYEVNMDDDQVEDDGILNYAAQGFGQLNHQIGGTYGALMNKTNTSNNFGNNGYNNFGNSLGTYSQLINNPVTRTKYR